MDEKDLVKFLIEAKKGTYANSNAPRIKSSRLGSSDYEYVSEVDKKTITYHDTYFGGVNFIGEEVVYFENDKPFWGMNYYGITLDKSLGEAAMDAVLRPALMMVGDDDIIPVRGPREFKNGEYVYKFNVQGSINNFSGTEEIYKKDKIIYRLLCHGGNIE